MFVMLVGDGGVLLELRKMLIYESLCPFTRGPFSAIPVEKKCLHHIYDVNIQVTSDIFLPFMP